jgi:5-methylthioadenosine/S-adenosylhomocysteine deaminase
MNRIALSPVTAVTCNPNFEVLENAAIHLENGRITFIGDASTQPAFDANEILGGEHLVAIPGLVNTHTHTAMTLLRGYADDMALEPWLQTKIWPFEKNLDGDDVYWGTLLAVAEMLRGGTTTCADMYHFYERGVQAFIESGMRVCPGGVLLGFLPEPEKRIANAIAFACEYSHAADGRITPFLAPHSLYTCNKDHWKKMIEGAHENNLMLHTHVAETQREVADVIKEWGASPVQTLKNIGALDGPLLAAHCVHVDERDLEIMGYKDGDTSQLRVAHNPTSNLKLASGFAPIPEYLKRGITVGLAPDGTASNNKLDMWQEMRFTALLHKATTGDPTVVSAEQALRMATIEGAKCLNLAHEIGSLEVGKKADIVLVNFDKPHLTPRHNVISHLVYAANSSDVETTIVDGRVLMCRDEYSTLDVEKIKSETNARAQKLVTLAKD